MLGYNYGDQPYISSQLGLGIVNIHIYFRLSSYQFSSEVLMIESKMSNFLTWESFCNE